MLQGLSGLVIRNCGSFGHKSQGGAVRIFESSSPTIDNCIIEQSKNENGALYTAGSPQLTDVVFRLNEGISGGADWKH